MYSTTFDLDHVIHFAIELSSTTWLVAARLRELESRSRSCTMMAAIIGSAEAAISSLRARVAKSLRRLYVAITEFSEHESNGRELDEGERSCG